MIGPDMEGTSAWAKEKGIEELLHNKNACALFPQLKELFM